MHIYFYLAIWFGIGCFAGVLFGFLIAACFKASNEDQRINLLMAENEELEARNDELNLRISAIKGAINKYFPEK